MKVGAEPSKVAILGALLLAAAYLVYTNLSSGPAEPGRPPARLAPRPAIEVTPSTEAVVQARPAVARAGTPKRSEQEFHPSFKHKGVIDPGTIDPSLRHDLLAKVESVELGPPGRNLFQFGAAPPAALPPGVRDPGKIKVQPKLQAAPVPVIPSGPPPPPPPPPITLKYYGYTAQRTDGHKQAFFTDGDCTVNAPPTAQCDIFVAAEGELIMKRYKVVRIGVSSVEVEDTQYNHTQPLPLAQEAPG
jgi:hypothetical protein